MTEKYTTTDVSWQWLLGRLYIIERLVKDFPTEFLPRQRPDGASSESSLELIGATSKGDEERPQNYDRLLTVAEFAVKAVSNQHARISRVAKRVFLLAARYAAHLESLVTEFFNLLNELDFTHKKSLKRQLEKIVADFQLSEQLGRHLNVHNLIDRESSPVDSTSVTPLSSPKCVSPATVLSDIPSASSSIVPSEASNGALIMSKYHPLAPPNTPIHDRRLQETKTVFLQYSDSLDHTSQDEDRFDENYGRLKPSKSLDDLDSVDCKPRSRFSKSPRAKKVKSRSRSTTPQRIGPVLETNLDEVIKIEEEARQRRNSFFHSDQDDSVFETDESDILGPPKALVSLSPAELVPSPRLLSHDLETDIDSTDLDIDVLLRRNLNASADGDMSLKLPGSSIDITNTPKLKHSKIPKNLALDLSPSGSQKSRRSISPCAHVLELDRQSTSKKISASGSDSAGHSPTFQQAKSICSGSRKSLNISGEFKYDQSSRPKDSSMSRSISSSTFSSRREKLPSASGKSDYNDSYIDYIAITPCSGSEKPVTFKTEVAMATPKHSPSNTLDRGKVDTYKLHCTFNH